jgi:hypothetical protein
MSPDMMGTAGVVNGGLGLTRLKGHKKLAMTQLGKNQPGAALALEKPVSTGLLTRVFFLAEMMLTFT